MKFHLQCFVVCMISFLTDVRLLPATCPSQCHKCNNNGGQQWCDIQCYNLPSNSSCWVDCPSGYNCYMDCSKPGCSSLSSINCTAAPAGACEFDCSGESIFLPSKKLIFFKQKIFKGGCPASSSSLNCGGYYGSTCEFLCDKGTNGVRNGEIVLSAFFVVSKFCCSFNPQMNIS